MRVKFEFLLGLVFLHTGGGLQQNSVRVNVDGDVEPNHDVHSEETFSSKSTLLRKAPSSRKENPIHEEAATSHHHDVLTDSQSWDVDRRSQKKSSESLDSNQDWKSSFLQVGHAIHTNVHHWNSLSEDQRRFHVRKAVRTGTKATAVMTSGAVIGTILGMPLLPSSMLSGVFFAAVHAGNEAYKAYSEISVETQYQSFLQNNAMFDSDIDGAQKIAETESNGISPIDSSSFVQERVSAATDIVQAPGAICYCPTPESNAQLQETSAQLSSRTSSHEEKDTIGHPLKKGTLNPFTIDDLSMLEIPANARDLCLQRLDFHVHEKEQTGIEVNEKEQFRLKEECEQNPSMDHSGYTASSALLELLTRREKSRLVSRKDTLNLSKKGCQKAWVNANDPTQEVPPGIANALQAGEGYSGHGASREEIQKLLTREIQGQIQQEMPSCAPYCGNLQVNWDENKKRVLIQELAQEHNFIEKNQHDFVGQNQVHAAYSFLEVGSSESTASKKNRRANEEAESAEGRPAEGASAEVAAAADDSATSEDNRVGEKTADDEGNPAEEGKSFVDKTTRARTRGTGRRRRRRYEKTGDGKTQAVENTEKTKAKTSKAISGSGSSTADDVKSDKASAWDDTESHKTSNDSRGGKDTEGGTSTDRFNANGNEKLVASKPEMQASTCHKLIAVRAQSIAFVLMKRIYGTQFIYGPSPCSCGGGASAGGASPTTASVNAAVMKGSPRIPMELKNPNAGIPGASGTMRSTTPSIEVESSNSYPRSFQLRCSGQIDSFGGGGGMSMMACERSMFLVNNRVAYRCKQTDSQLSQDKMKVVYVKVVNKQEPSCGRSFAELTHRGRLEPGMVQFEMYDADSYKMGKVVNPKSKRIFTQVRTPTTTSEFLNWRKAAKTMSDQVAKQRNDDHGDQALSDNHVMINGHSSYLESHVRSKTKHKSRNDVTSHSDVTSHHSDVDLFRISLLMSLNRGEKQLRNGLDLWKQGRLKPIDEESFLEEDDNHLKSHHPKNDMHKAALLQKKVKQFRLQSQREPFRNAIYLQSYDDSTFSRIVSRSSFMQAGCPFSRCTGTSGCPDCCPSSGSSAWDRMMSGFSKLKSATSNTPHHCVIVGSSLSYDHESKSGDFAAQITRTMSSSVGYDRTAPISTGTGSACSSASSEGGGSNRASSEAPDSPIYNYNMYKGGSSDSFMEDVQTGDLYERPMVHIQENPGEFSGDFYNFLNSAKQQANRQHRSDIQERYEEKRQRGAEEIGLVPPDDRPSKDTLFDAVSRSEMETASTASWESKVSKDEDPSDGDPLDQGPRPQDVVPLQNDALVEKGRTKLMRREK